MDQLHDEEYLEIPRSTTKEDVKFHRAVRLPSNIFWRLTRIFSGTKREESEKPEKRISRKAICLYSTVILLIILVSVIVISIAITQLQKRGHYQKEVYIGGEDQPVIPTTTPRSFLLQTVANLPPPPELNQVGQKGRGELFKVNVPPQGRGLVSPTFDVTNATVALLPAYDFRQGVVEFTDDNGAAFVLCYDDIVDVEKDDIARAVCGSLNIDTLTGARVYGVPVEGGDNTPEAVLSCPNGALNLDACLSPNGVSSCTEKLGVICHAEEPFARLISGRIQSEGVVQMYLNGTWGYVCPGPTTGAEIICAYLGHRDRFAKFINAELREVDVPKMPRHPIKIDCVSPIQPGDITTDCQFEGVYDTSVCDDRYLFLQCEPAGPLPKNIVHTPNDNLVLIPPSPITSPGCDFEEGLATCGWTQAGTDRDQLDWIVTCRKDQTKNTGPLHGAGFGPNKRCYLLYDSNIRTELGRAVKMADTAIVSTPLANMNGKCIRFFYNIFGDTFSSFLGVYQVTDSGTVTLLRGLSFTADHPVRGWQSITLEAGHHPNSRIEFVANHNAGPRSNLAIDQVDISEEACASLSDTTLIRLADGPTAYEGRLEVYHAGQWGTVCGDNFGQVEADLVCQKMGLQHGEYTPDAPYGPGTGPIWLDEVSCSQDDESFIYGCDHNPFGITDCEHDEDVGLACYNYAEVLQLSGGANVMEGRVEVYHDGSWGSVCDSNFTITDATAVCKMLGFGYGEPQWVSSGSGTIWIADVECSDDTPSIFQCNRDVMWGTEPGSCSHANDVGVTCYYSSDKDRVRLIGSSSSGRLEVEFGGTWGTVCSTDFNIPEATAACKTLGFQYGTLETVAGLSEIVSAPANIMENVDCYGNENSIFDCSYSGPSGTTCGSGTDVSIMCYHFNEIIRLVEGEGDKDGRLEIQDNLLFGTVCDDDFRGSSVACRNLFYSGYGIANTSAPEGSGSLPIHRSYVECRPSDNNIFLCPYDEPDCQNYEDIGVKCYSKSLLVRLSGGSRRSGRVEVYHEGEWGTVCSSRFDDVDAQTVCNQLGLGSVLDVFTADPGTGPIWISELGCAVGHTNIADCSADYDDDSCTHAQDIGITCGTYSDERKRQSCPLGYALYDLGQEYICIPFGQICNNRLDNGLNLLEEEADCGPPRPGAVLCLNGTYIPSYYRCDGVPNCEGAEDEAGCSCTGADRFACTNGACIHTSFQCDGKNQCGDWSDEVGCSCTNGFVCQTENICLPSELRCGWKQQCPSGDDRIGCTWQCDFENGDSCSHRIIENVELSGGASIPMTVELLNYTNAALKSSVNGQYGYFVTPVALVPSKSCLTFNHQGLGNRQAAIYIQITYNDQSVQEWFYVTPSNNTWNTSKIEIYSPYNEVLMRAMFGLWDAYIDDIDLVDGPCYSTPRNRARNPQGVLTPVNSITSVDTTCDFDLDDCDFAYTGLTRISVGFQLNRLHFDAGDYSVGRLTIDSDQNWGSFCKDGWNDERATIVCRGRGFSYGILLGGYAFGGNGVPPYINQLYCPKGYQSLFECFHDGFYSGTCSNDERVTIQCFDYNYPSLAAAQSLTSFMTTDGTETISLIYSEVHSSAQSVQFSYRMPKGYWIYVFGLCDSDFTPYTFDMFTNSGTVFTEPTAVGEWVTVEADLACTEKVFFALKSDSTSSIQITNITFSSSAASNSLLCTSQQLVCETARQCYPLLKFCDGVYDCLDGSDERNCTSAICDDNGPVPSTYRSCEETTVGGNDTNAYCVEACQPGPDPYGGEGTWCITADGWGPCVGDAIGTTGGSAGGAICQFPFSYNYQEYYGCTTIGHNRPWCGTTRYYNGLWGDCSGCPKTGCLRNTERGATCKIPFFYKDQKYYACTTKDDSKEWCYVDDAGTWDYCTGCANALCEERTIGGTMNGRRCTFPFIFNGVEYNQCTTLDNAGVRWCAGTSNYDTDPLGLWGNCAGCPELDPCWYSTFGGTAGGATCSFPFVYQGETYYDCTNVDFTGYDGRWCSTTPYFDLAGSWGICGECLPTPFSRAPVCAGTHKSFNDGTLEGGTTEASAAIVWSVTNGNLPTSYRCPRISADRYTPVADLKSALEENLGRKANVYAPGTTAGGYIYAQWSDPAISEGSRSSISFSTNIKMTCLSFCYYVSGEFVGSLAVFVDSNLVWVVQGHQGDEWHCTKIEFGGHAISAQFEVVKGSGDNFGTCIAIDRVTFSEKCERSAFAADNCAAGSFDCGGGQCISESKYCDCVRNCWNDADENNCGQGCTPGFAPVEPVNQLTNRTFTCSTGENILAEELCDGVHHCSDAEDEIGCACQLNELSCDGYCIPAAKFCDRVVDCPGGQDEATCSNGCPLDFFQCDNGQCVPIANFCDGSAQCNDGSDEQEHICPQQPCSIDISGLPVAYSLTEAPPATLDYFSQYTLKINCDGTLWNAETSYDMYRHLVLECNEPGATLTVSSTLNLKCIPDPPARFFPCGPAHLTNPLPMEVFSEGDFAEIPIRFNDNFKMKGRVYNSVLVSNNGFIRFGTSIADANSPVCFDFMSQDNFPYDGLFSLLGIQLTTAVNDDALIYIDEYDGLEYRDELLISLNEEGTKLNTAFFNSTDKFKTKYALVISYQNLKDAFLNVYDAQLAFIQDEDENMFAIWNYNTHPGILNNNCHLGGLTRTADYMLINGIATTGNVRGFSNYGELGRYYMEVGTYKTHYLPPNLLSLGIIDVDTFFLEGIDTVDFDGVVPVPIGLFNAFDYPFFGIGFGTDGVTTFGFENFAAYPQTSCLESFVPVEVTPAAYILPVNIDLSFPDSPGGYSITEYDGPDDPNILEMKAEVCAYDASECVGWEPVVLLGITYLGIKPNYTAIDTAMTFQVIFLSDYSKTFGIFIYGLMLEYLPEEYCGPFLDDGVVVNGDKIRRLGVTPGTYWPRQFATNAATAGRWVISLDGFPCPVPDVDVRGFVVSTPLPYLIPTAENLDLEFECVNGSPFDIINGHSSLGGERLNPRNASCPPYYQGELINVTELLQNFDCIGPLFPCCSEFSNPPESTFDSDGIISYTFTTPLHSGLRVKETFWSKFYAGNTGFLYFHNTKSRTAQSCYSHVTPEVDDSTNAFSLFSLEFDTPYLYIDELIRARSDYEDMVLLKLTSHVCSYWDIIEDVPCGFDGSYGITLTSIRSELNGQLYTGQLAFITDGGETFVIFSYVDYSVYNDTDCGEEFGMITATADLFNIKTDYPNVLTMSNFNKPGQFIARIGQYITYYHPPNMFPYGIDAGDTIVDYSYNEGSLANDDQTTITLTNDLHAFDFTQTRLSVSSEGYINLGTASSSFDNSNCLTTADFASSSGPYVLAHNTDFDADTSPGYVAHRQTTDAATLNAMENIVCENYDCTYWEGAHAAIITYHGLAVRDASLTGAAIFRHKSMTFQISVVTNGTTTYGIFIYGLITDYNLPCYEWIGARIPSGFNRTWDLLGGSGDQDDYFTLQSRSNVNIPGVWVISLDGFPCPYDDIPSGVFTLVPNDDDVTEVDCEDSFSVEFLCDPEGTPFDSAQGPSGTGRILSPRTASCTPQNQGEVISFGIDITEWECIPQIYICCTELGPNFATEPTSDWQTASLSSSYPIKGDSESSFTWNPEDGMLFFTDRESSNPTFSAYCASQMYDEGFDRFSASFHLANLQFNDSIGMVFFNEYSTAGSSNEIKALEQMNSHACYYYSSNFNDGDGCSFRGTYAFSLTFIRKFEVNQNNEFTGQLAFLSDGTDTYVIFSYNDYTESCGEKIGLWAYTSDYHVINYEYGYALDTNTNVNATGRYVFRVGLKEAYYVPENFLEFGPDLDSSTQYNDILGDDSGYVATLSSSINVFDYDVEKLFINPNGYVQFGFTASSYDTYAVCEMPGDSLEQPIPYFLALPFDLTTINAYYDNAYWRQTTRTSDLNWADQRVEEETGVSSGWYPTQAIVVTLIGLKLTSNSQGVSIQFVVATDGNTTYGIMNYGVAYGESLITNCPKQVGVVVNEDLSRPLFSSINPDVTTLYNAAFNTTGPSGGILPARHYVVSMDGFPCTIDKTLAAPFTFTDIMAIPDSIECTEEVLHDLVCPTYLFDLIGGYDTSGRDTFNPHNVSCAPDVQGTTRSFEVDDEYLCFQALYQCCDGGSNPSLPIPNSGFLQRNFTFPSDFNLDGIDIKGTLRSGIYIGENGIITFTDPDGYPSTGCFPDRPDDLVLKEVFAVFPNSLDYDPNGGVFFDEYQTGDNPFETSILEMMSEDVHVYVNSIHGGDSTFSGIYAFSVTYIGMNPSHSSTDLAGQVSFITDGIDAFVIFAYDSFDLPMSYGSCAHVPGAYLNKVDVFDILSESNGSPDSGTNCGHTGRWVYPVALQQRLRLADGPYSWWGRPEYFYNTQWGTFNTVGFTTSEGDVICNQLGFASSVVSPAFFSPDEAGKSCLVNELSCTSSETTFTNCMTVDLVQPLICDHVSFDAGMHCSGDQGRVRLKPGPHIWAGTLEAYSSIASSWGWVCGDGWTPEATEVVCRMLNAKAIDAYPTQYYGVTEQANGVFFDVKCFGSESGLQDCFVASSGSCNTGPIAIECEEQIRLRGPAPFVGRVELHLFHSDEWVSVQDSGQTLAEHTCYSLGLFSEELVGGPGITDSLFCDSMEPYGALLNTDACNDYHPLSCLVSSGVAYSVAPQQAGVFCIRSCTGGVKAVLDKVSSLGLIVCQLPCAVMMANACGRVLNNMSKSRVIIAGEGEEPSPVGLALVPYYDDLYGVCATSFDNNDADVICNSAGFNGGSSLGVTGGPPPIIGLSCSGSESSVFDCSEGWLYSSHYCSSGPVAVKCNYNIPGEAVRLFAAQREGTDIAGVVGFPQVYLLNVWGYMCDQASIDGDSPDRKKRDTAWSYSSVISSMMSSRRKGRIPAPSGFAEYEANTVCLNMGYQSGEVMTAPSFQCGFPIWDSGIDCGYATYPTYEYCDWDRIFHICTDSDIVYLKCFYHFVGCYKDNASPLMPNMTTSFDGTIEGCMAYCRDLDWKFAALQAGDECHCGDDEYDDVGLCADQGCTCDTACTGDGTKKCGGTNANSVYLAVDDVTGLYNCFDQMSNTVPDGFQNYELRALTLQQCRSHCDKIDVCEHVAWKSNPLTCLVYYSTSSSFSTSYGFTTFNKTPCGGGAMPV